ncbi:MAG: hypothetical protein FWB91_04805 [Defluviitaleaceae bacterium]|nr:hypothetical protein [Defluviitaleaceae bacterium]
MRNKSAINKICLLAFVLMGLGTLVNISNPDNVPIGIALMIVSAVLFLVASFIALRQMQYKEKLEEDRLKQIEDDVAFIKKHIKKL